MSDNQGSVAPDPTAAKETSLNSHAYAVVSDDGASEEWTLFTTCHMQLQMRPEPRITRRAAYLSRGGQCSYCGPFGPTFRRFRSVRRHKKALLHVCNSASRKPARRSGACTAQPGLSGARRRTANLIEAAKDYSVSPPERLPRDSILTFAVRHRAAAAGTRACRRRRRSPVRFPLAPAVRRVPTGRKSSTD